MKGIARDEARHAQLSWDLATWLDENIDEDALGRVQQARERAVDDLLRQTAIEPDAVLARELGVPTPNEARAMARSLRASLWSKCAWLWSKCACERKLCSQRIEDRNIAV